MSYPVVLPLRAEAKKDPLPWLSDRLPQPPFFMSIVAPVRSGKSLLISNLIAGNAFYRSPKGKSAFDHVILISPTCLSDASLAPIVDAPLVSVYTDPELTSTVISDAIADSIAEGGKASERSSVLIIIDDCLGAKCLARGGALSNLASRYRHYNLSVICAIQAWKGLSPTIRACTNFWILFRTHNAEEREKIVAGFSGVPDFEKIFTEVTSTPHSFLCVDVRKGRGTKRFEEIVFEN